MFRPRIHGCIALLALACGCTGMTQTGGSPTEGRPGARNPAPANVNLSGFSPAFRQGYAAGCDSAKSGVSRRDEDRFRSDADYKMGWNDGNSMCRR